MKIMNRRDFDSKKIFLFSTVPLFPSLYLSVAASHDSTYLRSLDSGVGSLCKAQYTLAANSSVNEIKIIQ